MAGHVWPAPPAAQIAPTDHAVRLRAPPGFVAIGSLLTPVGWSALIPAGLGYRNEIVALTGDLPASAGDDELATVAALDAWLTTRLRAATIDRRVAVIDAWLLADGVADIDALAAALGLSRRALERLTRRTHGATPGRLAAKYRALRIAADLVAGQTVDWRDAAAAAGLADQSHLIREFRRFVGEIPGRFVTPPHSFAYRLLRGQWHPRRTLSIAIWS